MSKNKFNQKLSLVDVLGYVMYFITHPSNEISLNQTRIVDAIYDLLIHDAEDSTFNMG